MRRVLWILTAAVVLAVPLPGRAAGSLDHRFGYAQADFGGNDISHDMYVQPDGKVVLAGYTEARGGKVDLAVARFTTSGVLDRSFSKDGKLTLNFLGTEFGYAVAGSPGGKIVVAGFTFDDGVTFGDFAVARLNKDGSLDKTFGTNGKAIINVSGWIDLPLSIVVEPDGKIVAAGATLVPLLGAGSSIQRDMIGAGELVRLLPDGTPDPTFGVGGRLLVKMNGGVDMLWGIARGPGGTYVVAGETAERDNAPTNIFVNRYLTTGTPDPTFGQGGSSVFSMGGSAALGDLAVTKDGTVAVSAGTAGGLSVMRLRADGTPDRRFGGDGRSMVPMPGPTYGRSVAIQKDGKVLATGAWLRCYGTFCLPYVEVVRFTKSGSADKTFGSRGKVGIDQMWWAETLQIDGGTVVVGGWGFGGNGNDFKALRLRL